MVQRVVREDELHGRRAQQIQKLLAVLLTLRQPPEHDGASHEQPKSLLRRTVRHLEACRATDEVGRHQPIQLVPELLRRADPRVQAHDGHVAVAGFSWRRLRLLRRLCFLALLAGLPWLLRRLRPGKRLQQQSCHLVRLGGIRADQHHLRRLQRGDSGGFLVGHALAPLLRRSDHLGEVWRHHRVASVHFVWREEGSRAAADAEELHVAVLSGCQKATNVSA
mmetsp:Transcript_10396/g.39329  ORF Transcript_10396/g.39329 Transcript_10396/m.39329 type:complete len:222 (+) Transcript_10396:926-1591(+)